MTSDKAYAVEQRLNNLLNALGPVSPAAGGGGDSQPQTVYAGSLPQTISTGSYVDIHDLSYPVVAGTYHILAHLIIVCNTGGAQASFQFKGGTVSGFLASLRQMQTSTNTAVLYNITSSSAYTAAGNGINTNIALGTGAGYIIDIDAGIVFSGGGTLTLGAATTVGADTYNITLGSYWTVTPVGQTS